MASAKFQSRAAATTLIALSLAAPAAVAPSRPAAGQTLSPSSLDITPLRDLPTVPSIPGLGAAPPSVSQPMTQERRAAPELSSGAPNYGLPRVRARLPRPNPPPAP